jgi:hypothetical protein
MKKQYLELAIDNHPSLFNLNNISLWNYLLIF